MASADWKDYEVMAERWKHISHEARTNLGNGDNGIDYKPSNVPRARSRGGPGRPGSRSRAPLEADDTPFVSPSTTPHAVVALGRLR